MLAGSQNMKEKTQGREREAATKSEEAFRKQMLSALGQQNPGSNIAGQGDQSPITATNIAGTTAPGTGPTDSLETTSSSDSASKDGDGMSLGNEGKDEGENPQEG